MTKAVIFDLDGVLIDSRAPTRKAILHTLEHFHYRLPSEEEFLPYYGITAPKLLRIFLGKVDEPTFEKVFEHAKSALLEVIPQIQLMPHCLEMLEDLSKSGNRDCF